MKHVLQKVFLVLVGIGLVSAFFAGALPARAQVSQNYWQLFGGTIKPNISTWTLTLPYLPSKNCIGTDSNGLLQAGTCGSSNTGLATTSPWLTGNVAYVVDDGHVSSVATSTATINSPLSGTLTTLGGSDLLSISQANGSTDGYLSSSDWNTFNGKQAAISATYPVTLTGSAVGLAFGTTTSNTWAGTQTFTNPIVVGGTAGSATSTFSTGISVGTGYSPYPEYTFNSDTNTGIDSSGPDIMEFVNGGATTMILTSANRVGISTTTPYHPLSIGGNVYIGAPTAGGTNGDLYVAGLANAAGTFLAADATGKLIATSTPTGAITSVSNSDGTLTISPTTGSVVASLALGHANTWTALQTFGNASTTLTSVSSGLYNTYLTATRIPFTTTNGLLTDTSSLTWNGTKLTTTYASTTALTASTALAVGTTGAMPANSVFYVSGGTSLSGNVAMGGTAIDSNITLVSATNVNDPAAAQIGAQFQKTVVLTADNSQTVIGGRFLVAPNGSAFNYNGKYRGGSFEVQGGAGSGKTIANADAGYFFVYHTTAGTITNLSGANVEVQNLNASGVVTNLYAHKAKINFNFGTITNTYGFYVDDITTGTQTNTPYGFYNSDANSWNYFAANTGIGSTTPWGLLSVNPNALGSGVPSFVVGSSTATRFIVADTGNVGIGTTTPSSILSIQGVANFVANAASTFYNDLRILGNLILPSLGTPAGAFLAVDANGQVIATSTPTSNASYLSTSLTAGTTTTITSPTPVLMSSAKNFSIAYDTGTNASAASSFDCTPSNNAQTLTIGSGGHETIFLTWANAGGTGSFNGATMNGVSMTIATTTSDGIGNMVIAYAAATTTGNAVVAVDCTYGSSNKFWSMAAYSGTNTSSPIDVYKFTTGVSGSITTLTDGSWSGALMHATTGSFSSGSNCTSRQSTTGRGIVMYCDSNGAVSPAGSLTQTAGGTPGGTEGMIQFTIVPYATPYQGFDLTSAATTASSSPFIGFITSSPTSGTSQTVYTQGRLTGFSGLTVGSVYYLSNTLGQISTSAGSVSHKVGVAVSATDLIITQD